MYIRDIQYLNNRDVIYFKLNLQSWQKMGMYEYIFPSSSSRIQIHVQTDMDYQCQYVSYH